MKKLHIEIRPGDWFWVRCINHDYGIVHFNEPQKIAKVDGKFFQIKYHHWRHDKDEKYTITNYEFTRLPKEECDEKMRLIAKIDKAEKLVAIKIMGMVRKIEKIDDEINVGYHDGKYASQDYI